MEPKWIPKVIKNNAWGAQGSTLSPSWVDFGLSQNIMFLESSLVAQKIRKMGPKAAQEAPTWPRGFADAPSLGGQGPWGGLARDMKLDTRSMKHETRIMKHETRNMKHETT